MSTVDIKPPIPGMRVVPDHCGTPEWEFLYGGAWTGLCEFAISKKEYRDAFKEDTGHDLSHLVGHRSPLDAMIDTATHRSEVMMAAWCDWVTENLWGKAAP